jgi:hypothetical protein
LTTPREAVIAAINLLIPIPLREGMLLPEPGDLGVSRPLEGREELIDSLSDSRRYGLWNTCCIQYLVDRLCE